MQYQGSDICRAKISRIPKSWLLATNFKLDYDQDYDYA